MTHDDPNERRREQLESIEDSLQLVADTDLPAAPVAQKRLDELERLRGN
jgi:Flp pilus assembly CpaE family ATPase